jgi:hypothetical protein
MIAFIKNFDYLFSDITGFVSTIKIIFESANKVKKREYVRKLKNDKDLKSIYINPDTSQQVYKHIYTSVLEHEMNTAVKLTLYGYDVVFAPKGMFKRNEKRFDIFLIKNNEVVIKADLKSNFEGTVNSISNSIVAGNEQAENIVIDFLSNIHYKNLIDGLRMGLKASSKIKNLIIFYKKEYYAFDRSIIFSKQIYRLLK